MVKSLSVSSSIGVNESSDSIGRDSSFSRSKPKSLITMSAEELRSLEQEYLHSLLKALVQNLKSHQTSLWRCVEEKRVVVFELVKRSIKDSAIVGDDRTSSDGQLFHDRICGHNGLIRQIIETIECDNTLVVNVVENLLNNFTLLGHFRDHLEEFYNSHNRFLEHHASSLSGELRQKLYSEVEDGLELVKSLSRLMPAGCDGIKNYSLDYMLKGYLNDYDETKEKNRIMSFTLHQQTDIIAKLSLEIKRLKILLAEKDTASSENGKAVVAYSYNAPTGNLTSGIAPLRGVLEKYRHEWNRSLKTLESLLETTRTARGGCISYPKADSNGTACDLDRAIAMCMATAEMLTSIKPETTKTHDHCEKINNAEKFTSVLSNLKKLQSDLENIFKSLTR